MKVQQLLQSLSILLYAINSWVENITAGKICNVIAADSLGATTGLVLINALHFKGAWKEQFNETRMGDFWIDNKKSVKVEYMRKNARFKFSNFKYLDCEAVELAYENSDLSMFILMPNDKDGLLALAEKLIYVNLLDLSDHITMVDIIVQIPKFKIGYSVGMTEVLKEMGIQKAFSHQADFSNMVNSPEGLCISDIVHKTIIEVNEQGTEAAAVSGLTMILCCEPTEFIADHPFFYWIWNNENILFAGAFVNPPTIE